MFTNDENAVRFFNAVLKSDFVNEIVNRLVNWNRFDDLSYSIDKLVHNSD